MIQLDLPTGSLPDAIVNVSVLSAVVSVFYIFDKDISNHGRKGYSIVNHTLSFNAISFSFSLESLKITFLLVEDRGVLLKVFGEEIPASESTSSWSTLFKSSVRESSVRES